MGGGNKAGGSKCTGGFIGGSRGGNRGGIDGGIRGGFRGGVRGINPGAARGGGVSPTNTGGTRDGGNLGCLVGRSGGNPGAIGARRGGSPYLKVGGAQMGFRINGSFDIFRQKGIGIIGRGVDSMVCVSPSVEE